MLSNSENYIQAVGPSYVRPYDFHEKQSNFCFDQHLTTACGRAGPDIIIPISSFPSIILIIKIRLTGLDSNYFFSFFFNPSYNSIRLTVCESGNIFRPATQSV